MRIGAKRGGLGEALAPRQRAGPSGALSAGEHVPPPGFSNGTSSGLRRHQLKSRRGLLRELTGKVAGPELAT